MSINYGAFASEKEFPPAGEGLRVPYWIEKLWVRLEQQEQRIAFLEQALKEKNT